MFSSADGYCSSVVFSDGELGLKYEKQPEITVQEYDIEMMDISSNTEINILQPHKRKEAVTESATLSTLEKPKKRRVTPILISTPFK
jgi:chromatin assembly factor 1 subunit B